MWFLRYYGLEKLYEEKWYKKRAKEAILGKIFEAVPVPKQGDTGTGQQKPIGTGTGTTLQNAFGTSTDQSGTGTTLPQNAQIVVFSHI